MIIKNYSQKKDIKIKDNRFAAHQQKNRNFNCSPDQKISNQFIFNLNN